MRDHLEVAVWHLTTLLTLGFSCKVAVVVLGPVQIITLVLGGIYYCLFLHREAEKVDAVAAASFWNHPRVSTASSGVLCALRRWHWSPLRAGHYEDPREVAWCATRLILDSGAAKHAVGNVWILEGFQRHDPPWSATVADGRGVRVLGTGRIERWDDDSGLGFSIPKVDLAEGLRDGLISVSQLARDHGLVSSFGSGVCRITRAKDGTEVGGAFLGEDGMYVLRYLLVPDEAPAAGSRA